MLPPSTLSRYPAAAALAAALLCYTATARIHAAESRSDASLGRIDFEKAGLPPANIELDLSQGTFENLFGIGDAAVAGVAETLSASASGEHAQATRMAAEQLAALRKVIGLSSKVIHEVRVRAYEKMAEDLASRFDEQLGSGKWERLAVVRKERENARVFVNYKDNAIRGIFVVASGNGGQVLVNVVCDVSPENVKQLTSAATKIGLDNGLQRELEVHFRSLHRPGPAAAPPQPPRAPDAPNSSP